MKRMNELALKIRHTWYAPTFSSLLQNRSEILVIVGAGGLNLGLALAGLPGWACPIKSTLGIPCPGCGLTTACVQLLKGQPGSALQTHAFAPIFLFAFFVMLAVILLPKNQRDATALWVARFEQRTGVTSLVLTGLILYWGFRLVGLA